MRRKHASEDRKERKMTKKRDDSDVRKIDNMRRGEEKEGLRHKKMSDLYKDLSKQHAALAKEHNRMTKRKK